MRLIKGHSLVILAVVVLACTSAAAAQEKAVATEPSQLKWAPCSAALPPGCETAVVRGNPAEGPAEIFLRTPTSYVFPRHWHTSAEHVVIVTGRLDGDIEGSGHVSIGPGGYLYVPGTTPHSGRCGDDAPCLFYIGLDKRTSTS